MPEIGATLREARMRARIDISEIEAQTKIRAKYLRALENEEWDLLPGPTFVKSFLRTYGQALGLDGKALVEEYKLSFEYPGEGPAEIDRSKIGQSAGASARRQRPRVRRGAGAPRGGGAPGGERSSRGYAIAVGAVAVVIVLLLIGLISGGGGGGNSKTNTDASRGAGSGKGVSSGGANAGRRHAPAVTRSTLASLKLEPSAEVYVCLIGDAERKRIPGVILKPGEPEPTYHARRFELTLGNNAVTLIVNEKPVTVPASSAAIGYAITRTGMRPLAAGELPTCT
jgi:cytoskeleton protein RodZ